MHGKPIYARVVLHWNDGRVSRVGKITFSPGPKLVDRPMRFFNQRFGWKLVLTGFRLMLRKGGKDESDGIL